MGVKNQYYTLFGTSGEDLAQYFDAESVSDRDQNSIGGGPQNAYTLPN